jgi:hypothetical protein
MCLNPSPSPLPLGKGEMRWQGYFGGTALFWTDSCGCRIGVILPLDAGTTAATGIGNKALHDSTSSVKDSVI